MNIEYTSIIDVSHKESIEALLFFNEMQNAYAREIEQSINMFGLPGIYEKNGLLRIKLGENESQAIYAIADRQVVGIIVYTIDTKDSLFIAHIAISSDFNFKGKHADSFLAAALMGKVVESARKLGKHEVRYNYSGRTETIKVKNWRIPNS